MEKNENSAVFTAYYGAELLIDGDHGDEDGSGNSSDDEDDDNILRRKKKRPHRPKAVHTRISLPNSLRSFYSPGLTDEEIEVRKNLIRDMVVSEDVNNYIQSSTKAQSNSLEWKELR